MLVSPAPRYNPTAYRVWRETFEGQATVPQCPPAQARAGTLPSGGSASGFRLSERLLVVAVRCEAKGHRHADRLREAEIGAARKRPAPKTPHGG